MASQPASSSTASARASPPPLSPPPPPPLGGVNFRECMILRRACSLDFPSRPRGDVNPRLVIKKYRLPQKKRYYLKNCQPRKKRYLTSGGAAAKQPPVIEKEKEVAPPVNEKEKEVAPPVMEKEKEVAPPVMEKEVPFAYAPSPVRAVLNRPWPDPVVIPPTSPSGKYRTLVATAKDIGPPITPEEFAALEDKDGDDLCTSHYKQIARINALKRNYIHEHGCLYMNEKNKFIFDNSILVEEIRCKYITAEEMEVSTMKQGSGSTYLSELALAIYNKRRKVKFELCEQLLCRSFWEDIGFFWHLNFIAKRKGSKKLFFAEIEDCGERSGETLQVCCCIPLDSLCEGGYYNWRSFSPSEPRKGLDMDRCYACTEFLKHPCNGLAYSGGHDYQRKTYLF
ncbi:unnamed protein product [Urochloa humidicola]